MIIQDARQKYIDSCSLSNGQAPFDDLVGQLIESGYSQSFNNDSYFDALWLTHHMLNRTYKSFSMLTGKGGEAFLETLEKPFVDALERVAKCGGKIRIILLNAMPQKGGFFERMIQNKALKMQLGSTRIKMGHFIVCDGKMIRAEDVHDEFTENSPASIINAKVNFNDPATAKAKENFFSAAWEKLKEPENNKS